MVELVEVVAERLVGLAAVRLVLPVSGADLEEEPLRVLLLQAVERLCDRVAGAVQMFTMQVPTTRDSVASRRGSTIARDAGGEAPSPGLR